MQEAAAAVVAVRAADRRLHPLPFSAAAAAAAAAAAVVAAAAAAEAAATNSRGLRQEPYQIP